MKRKQKQKVIKGTLYVITGVFILGTVGSIVISLL